MLRLPDDPSVNSTVPSRGASAACSIAGPVSGTKLTTPPHVAMTVTTGSDGRAVRPGIPGRNRGWNLSVVRRVGDLVRGFLEDNGCKDPFERLLSTHAEHEGSAP
jgi:hypothetical protein